MIDAKEYGKALFLLTEETRTTKTVAEELLGVKKLLCENPRYIKLLDTPALAKEEKLALVDRAFASLDGNLLNFVKILCEKHAVYQLPRVADVYAALYDEARGIERVEAVTAVAMTEKQLSALTNKLAALTGKSIVIRNTIDPTILGGVVLRYAGTQLDGSLRARLESFEKSLKDLVI
jgi:F-type H+-transporting ATPase subunit delta